MLNGRIGRACSGAHGGRWGGGGDSTPIAPCEAAAAMRPAIDRMTALTSVDAPSQVALATILVLLTAVAAI